jgi:hypothetical protein
VLRDLVGGNIDSDFAGAFRVQRRGVVAMVARVVVANMVVADVLGVIVRCGDFCVSGGNDFGICGGFESFS